MRFKDLAGIFSGDRANTRNELHPAATMASVKQNCVTVTRTTATLNSPSKKNGHRRSYSDNVSLLIEVSWVCRFIFNPRACSILPSRKGKQIFIVLDFHRRTSIDDTLCRNVAGGFLLPYLLRKQSIFGSVDALNGLRNGFVATFYR